MSLVPNAGIFSHNKYEGMGVDEILDELVTCKGCPIDSPLLKELTERSEKLVILLRKAVIREATVGTVSIATEPTDDYPCIDKLTLKDNRKHGWMEYDLIPKETT